MLGDQDVFPGRPFSGYPLIWTSQLMERGQRVVLRMNWEKCAVFYVKINNHPTGGNFNTRSYSSLYALALADQRESYAIARATSSGQRSFSV